MSAQPHSSPPPLGRAGLDEDIPCPRCRYNLRGLTTPRCPECGLEFDWSNLPEFRASASLRVTRSQWVLNLFVLGMGLLALAGLVLGLPKLLFVGLAILLLVAVVMGSLVPFGVLRSRRTRQKR